MEPLKTEFQMACAGPGVLPVEPLKTEFRKACAGPEVLSVEPLMTEFRKACAGPEVLPVEPNSEYRVSEGLVPLMRCSLKTEFRKAWCHS
jgi:hypothetical protein